MATGLLYICLAGVHITMDTSLAEQHIILFLYTIAHLQLALSGSVAPSAQWSPALGPLFYQYGKDGSNISEVRSAQEARRPYQWWHCLKRAVKDDDAVSESWCWWWWLKWESARDEQKLASSNGLTKMASSISLYWRHIEAVHLCYKIKMRVMQANYNGV